MLLRSRYRGALLGLAAGDALGAAVEFMPPGSFEPLTDLRAGGPHRLARGQWTDDTSMAMCLAESLAERGGFDAGDGMRRYVRWWRDGYWSSTGRCFDIGNATAAALGRFERTGDPLAGSPDPWTAGNGSLMRLAPVPLFFHGQGAAAVARFSAESSRPTHAAPEAVDACRGFGALIHRVLNGETKAHLLAPSPVFDPPLSPKVAAVLAGSFWRKHPPAIQGTGYVVDCLEAALWAFAWTDTFEAGALRAANLGEDADTTAAVYGQIAGAFYGEEAIPAGWCAALTRVDDIRALADRLHAVNPA